MIVIDLPHLVDASDIAATLAFIADAKAELNKNCGIAVDLILAPGNINVSPALDYLNLERQALIETILAAELELDEALAA